MSVQTLMPWSRQPSRNYLKIVNYFVEWFGYEKWSRSLDWRIKLSPWKLFFVLEKSLKSPWILFVWSCRNHGFRIWQGEKLEKRRANYKKQLSEESAEKKQERLAKMRASYNKRRSEETAEKKQERLAKRRANYKKKSFSATSEREARKTD